MFRTKYKKDESLFNFGHKAERWYIEKRMIRHVNFDHILETNLGFRKAMWPLLVKFFAYIAPQNCVL